MPESGSELFTSRGQCTDSALVAPAAYVASILGSTEIDAGWLVALMWLVWCIWLDALAAADGRGMHPLVRACRFKQPAPA